MTLDEAASLALQNELSLFLSVSLSLRFLSHAARMHRAAEAVSMARKHNPGQATTPPQEVRAGI